MLNRPFRQTEPRDLGDRYNVLQMSLSSPIGRFVCAHERALLAKLTREHRGHRILHLSAFDCCDVPTQSAFQKVTRVKPCIDFEQASPVDHDDSEHCLEHCSVPETMQSVLAAQASALPFESNSFDLVVVQHVLEYSASPQQVLKEAARVTENGGHMVLLGFNPVSAHGLCSLLWSRVRRGSLWERRALLVYRVRDWLSFVDFSNLQTRHLCHSLPLNQSRVLKTLSPITKLFTRLNVPFSSVYCLVSRKDELGFTQLKPDWRRLMLARALPVTTHKPSAATHANSNVTELYNNPETKH